MENNIEIRQFVRHTLNEVMIKLPESTKPTNPGESSNTMADIVSSEETRDIRTSQDVMDENALDDRKLHGADKVLAKTNDNIN